MAIDRVGKGGGLPKAPEAGGTGAATSTTKTGATFEVERPDRTDRTAAATNVDATAAATPLARLRAGEIDVHGYIDLKVNEATSELRGLAPAELEHIKGVLRDQMRTDPGLADMVQAATGKMPTPPEE
jgi:hypothetical protein